MTPLISVEKLNFAYEKSDLILQNVSLTVAAGESIAIFGPNGGGKTTFLKLLMGFLKPTKGKISLFGKAPKEMRSKIGYVPQTSEYDAQFPITLFELVLMGALSELTWFGRYPKESKQKAEEALAKVGLLHKQKAAFGTLSGGEKQRALLARALVGSPELLLLDEPTANVDSKAEEMIYSLLKELKNKMTIIMISHDLKTVIDQVDRLLCIHRTMCSYHPSEVCEHFTHGLYHSLPSREEVLL
jgi:zinc transport system ATP-binding protein